MHLDTDSHIRVRGSVTPLAVAPEILDRAPVITVNPRLYLSCGGFFRPSFRLRPLYHLICENDWCDENGFPSHRPCPFPFSLYPSHALFLFREHLLLFSGRFPCLPCCLCSRAW